MKVRAAPLLVLLVLGSCTRDTSPAPPATESTTTPVPAAPDASLPTTTPAVTGTEAPGAVVPGTVVCKADADCGAGNVCGRCSEGPGECMPGCSTAADCPAGERCVQVQCIRCPCPARCMPR